jgi:hypothetical protein
MEKLIAALLADKITVSIKQPAWIKILIFRYVTEPIILSYNDEEIVNAKQEIDRRKGIK